MHLNKIVLILTNELDALASASSERLTYGDVNRAQALKNAASCISIAAQGQGNHSYAEISRAIDSIKHLLPYKKRMRVLQIYAEWATLQLPGRRSEPEPVARIKSTRRTPSVGTDGELVLPSVLVLTAAKVEYDAAIELAGVRSNLGQRRRAVDGHIFIDLGFVNCSVWLFQCKKGSVGPGGATTRTVEALMSLVPRPIAVIVSGIAFGLRPGEQRLGDIIIGEQIRLYEAERRGHYRRIDRGDRASTSELLLDWCRSAEMDWGIEQPKRSRPRVHYGMVVSGEKLVDDPEFVGELLKLEPEAIGGEMEAAGVYSAAYSRQTHWIVVKGICDWGSGKGDKHQQVAAKNALDFVFHTLDQPVMVDVLSRNLQVDNLP